MQDVREMSKIELLEYNVGGLEEESIRRLYQQRLDKQLVDKEYQNTNEFYEHLKQAGHQVETEALGVKENNKTQNQ